MASIGASITVSRTDNAIDKELIYYSKLLPTYVRSLPRNRDQIINWINHLINAKVNNDESKQKRNKCLMMICINVMIGNVDDFFLNEPPEVLSELPRLSLNALVQPLWETDQTWDEIIDFIKEMEEKMNYKIKNPCSVHTTGPCSLDPNKQSTGELLDNHFKLFLHLSTPFVECLIDGDDRMRVSRWLQHLSSIGRKNCIISKGIRNDYMIALQGYLHNKMLRGPFLRMPTDTLIPLTEATDFLREHSRPVTDLTHSAFTNLGSDLPDLTEGAFAVISITGDMLDSNE